MTWTWKRKTVLFVALGLCLCLGAIRLLSFRREQADIAGLQELTAQLTEPRSRQIYPEERRAGWQQWRRQLDRLSPEQRREFWAEHSKELRHWLKSFMAASKSAQTEILNQVIGSIQVFRRQWREGGSAAAGPGWWAHLSPEELERRQQEWLAMTAPEERALVNAFQRMLAAQSQQLGLTSAPSPWGDDSPT